MVLGTKRIPGQLTQKPLEGELMQTERILPVPDCGDVQRHHRWRTGLPHGLFMLVLIMGSLAFPFGAILTVTTLGIPMRILEDSPFTSFVIPGLILCFIVGGSMLVAARLIWFEHKLAPMSAFAAGCILLGWISVEALMIPGELLIQTPFAIYALVIMGMAWRFRTYAPDDPDEILAARTLTKTSAGSTANYEEGRGRGGGSPL